MSRKSLELPPAAARRFVEDMLAYFAEPNGIKRDEIAARQLCVLKQHQTGKSPGSAPATKMAPLWASGGRSEGTTA